MNNQTPPNQIDAQIERLPEGIRGRLSKNFIVVSAVQDALGGYTITGFKSLKPPKYGVGLFVLLIKWGDEGYELVCMNRHEINAALPEGAGGNETG